MSARGQKSTPAPDAESPAEPVGALAVVDGDMVLYHAQRIKAAGGILDDVQRAHVYQGKGEQTQVTVLLDALALFLLEESTRLEAAARSALKGPKRKAVA